MTGEDTTTNRRRRDHSVFMGPFNSTDEVLEYMTANISQAEFDSGDLDFYYGLRTGTFGVRRVTAYTQGTLVIDNTLYWNGPFVTVQDLHDWIEDNPSVILDSIIPGTPTAGQVPTWNAGSSRYEPSTPTPGGGGGTPSLVGDVVATATVAATDLANLVDIPLAWTIIPSRGVSLSGFQISFPLNLNDAPARTNAFLGWWFRVSDSNGEFLKELVTGVVFKAGDQQRIPASYNGSERMRFDINTGGHQLRVGLQSGGQAVAALTITVNEAVLSIT